MKNKIRLEHDIFGNKTNIFLCLGYALNNSSLLKSYYSLIFEQENEDCEDEELQYLLKANYRRLLFSIIITIFCNPIFGSIGILFLLVARRHLNKGNKDIGIRYNDIGLYISLIGLSLSVVLLVGILIYTIIKANIF